MTNGRRTLIPLEFVDVSKWRGPSLEALSSEQQKVFVRRRIAISMYARGASYADIEAETGLLRPEVRRQIKRCLSQAADGQIFGWFGIVKDVRVKPYERVSPVTRLRGSGSGGCAGALTQLFAKYPEVHELVDSLYFGELSAEHLPEVRINNEDLHEHFKSALRTAGFTDADWPFNTENCGYAALRSYCRQLECNERNRAVRSRGGKEAANRTPLGNGHQSLFVPIRPYTSVQLDFHKVDAASVICISNDHGAEFEIPLARWHFGLVIEEVSGACLGFCAALELTPSGDSVLETVQNALNDSPGCSADANSALIYEMVAPLRQQCFSVLKMDNAWSNASTEVVNNIINVVGAAVNFGPVRSWWRRSLIERIFRRLTELGLQRLPSTFGSGVGDTRVDDPQANAAKFKIRIEALQDVFRQCIRKHNSTAGSRGQWMAPVDRLTKALAIPSSGVFANPLPSYHAGLPKLLMHREVVTVRGSVTNNIRPFFILGKHRHTNINLANKFWLIGKKLVVWVNRRLAREVHAVVADTGEELGCMLPAGPWSRSDCSWRDRVLIQRAGNSLHHRSEGDDPLAAFQRGAKTQLTRMTKAQRKKASRTALALEKSKQHKDNDSSVATPASEYSDNESSRQSEKAMSASKESPKRRNDPFGLSRVPQLKSVWGGE